jgi:hypothetical protein
MDKDDGTEYEYYIVICIIILELHTALRCFLIVVNVAV